MSNELSLEIISPEGVVFAGMVDSVTMKNSVGVFDVMPNHEFFVSSISGEVLVRKGELKKAYNTSSGIVVVGENKIKIFFDS